MEFLRRAGNLLFYFMELRFHFSFIVCENQSGLVQVKEAVGKPYTL